MSAAVPPMDDWRYQPVNRHDTVTIRIIWVAAFLSLLVHIAALWTSPPLVRSLAFDPSDKAEPSQALIAQLAPRASPPESAPPPTPPSPPSRTTPPPARSAPRPSPPPPPIVRNEPTPSAIPTPPPRPTPSTEAAPSPSIDLSAYIAARRNARGEPAMPSTSSDANAPPAENEKDRLNRIVAANLGLNKTPTFGDNPQHGGGVFQMKRVGYDDAEFFFNGWDEDIGRVARQIIEVRKGSNPDIRIAVVRKIIEIIRSRHREDFIWISGRGNRQVALSARPADNAALEAFMMREFFGSDQRQP